MWDLYLFSRVQRTLMDNLCSKMSRKNGGKRRFITTRYLRQLVIRQHTALLALGFDFLFQGVQFFLGFHGGRFFGGADLADF